MTPESAGTVAQVSVGVLLAIVIEARHYFTLFETERRRRRQEKPAAARAQSLKNLHEQAFLLFCFTVVAAAGTTFALLLSLLVAIDNPSDGSNLGWLVKLGVFIGLGYTVITPVRVYGLLFVIRFEQHNTARAFNMVGLVTWLLTLFYFATVPVFFGLIPDLRGP